MSEKPRRHTWVSYGGASWKVCLDCGLPVRKGVRFLNPAKNVCPGSKRERIEKYASDEANQ